MNNRCKKRIISWPEEMPGFEVDALCIREWWHIIATRDDIKIVGTGRTQDDAFAVIRRKYLKAYCPTKRIDHLQDLHRIIASANAARSAAITKGIRCAWRWISERWQQSIALILFVAILSVLFAAYGHWSSRLWLETIQ